VLEASLSGTLAGARGASANCIEEFYEADEAARSHVRLSSGGAAPQEVFPTITTGYAYPWEDLKVKDQ